MKVKLLKMKKIKYIFYSNRWSHSIFLLTLLLFVKSEFKYYYPTNYFYTNINDLTNAFIENLTIEEIKRIRKDKNYYIKNENLRKNLTIFNNMTLLEIAKAVTGDENVQLIEENITPVYECDCSKEHMEDGLATLDKDVLKEMIEEDGKAELVCHFCNKKYEFSKEELEDILEKNKK